MSFLGIFLAACEPMPAAASGILQPCTSTTPEANPYRAMIHPQVKSLYPQWVQNQSNSTIPQTLKNQAFTLLVDQVRRWSSFVDIPVDNANIIRITLTYISPELTQIMILNHQLYKNPLSEIDFENTLRTKMIEVAEREELIFLMTITYSQPANQIAIQNSITLNIPINELTLTNAENMHINANHVDPPLRQEIVISRGPSTGYIAFPIGVETFGNCTQVLESRWNTVINISMSGITVNGNEYAPQLSWSFKYHPLIEMDGGIISPSVNYASPAGIPIDYQPPPPVRVTSTGQPDSSYWEQMALYIWGYVTDP